jgi:hypothetical protein
MSKRLLTFILIGVFLVSNGGSILCAKLYFPPAGENWATVTPESLGWNTAALDEVYRYLESCHSKSFIILKDGKIAAERYWDPAGKDFAKQVFSAGKSITAFLIGIAQEQNLLKIEQPVSDFLGQGWTKAGKKQEKAIQIKHLLKMTSGLSTRKAYVGKPGTIWLYNTEVYHELHPLLEKATASTMQKFAEKVLFRPTGMNNSRFLNHTFKMTARDMARFGLMILAGGSWNGKALMKDQTFFKSMLDTAQSMNPAYGYLWWLNGKESFFSANPKLPRYDGFLIPDGPADMVAAMGANDQRIYVIPSQNLIVIRQGESAEEGEDALAISSFDNKLWQKIMLAIRSEKPAAESKSNPGLLQPQYFDADGAAYFDEAQTVPSWMHPEIRILSLPGGIDVTDTGIHEDGKYEMQVKIHNSGSQTAENVSVSGLYCEYGVTSDFKPFGKPFLIEKIAPGEAVEAQIRAVSNVAGHVCVKATVSCAGDADLSDNQGQRNLWIESADPGKTVIREMLVTNQALVKQKNGKWDIEPISRLRLISRVKIFPDGMNTPQNQAMVRIETNPPTISFDDTARVSREKARVSVNFDKKLPANIKVEVSVRPVSSEGKLLMDGCTWHFNLIKNRRSLSSGGM